MNWARGLKFAAIHVGIAIPLIASEEIPRWKTEKVHSTLPPPKIVLTAFQEEQTVEFYPCAIWRNISWRERVLIASELPVLIVAGWNEPCPGRWTLAGMVGIGVAHHSLRQRLALDLSICGLIAVQWILLGGLPLVKPHRWWVEPGAANTAMTCVLAPTFLICDGIASMKFPHAEVIASVLGLAPAFAFLLILSTWLAWIGLIAQRLGRFGWQAATASVRRLRTR